MSRNNVHAAGFALGLVFLVVVGLGAAVADRVFPPADDAASGAAADPGPEEWRLAFSIPGRSGATLPDLMTADACQRAGEMLTADRSVPTLAYCINIHEGTALLYKTH